MKHVKTDIGKNVIILGGCGKLGYEVAHLLLLSTNIRLTICGRKKHEIKRVAKELNILFPKNRVTPRMADISDFDSLTQTLQGHDAAIVCTSGSKHTENIIGAALANKVDCIDARYPQKAVHKIKSFANSIEKAGIRFVLQAGHLPGLPSSLLRYANQRFDSLKRVVLATAIQTPSCNSLGAAKEMVEIIQDHKGTIYHDGQWKKTSLKDTEKIDFDPPFGKRTCFPVHLEEMSGLPEQFSVEKTGVYVSGMNKVVDYLLIPFIMASSKIKGSVYFHTFGRALMWSINLFSSPPFGAVFKMDAEGVNKQGKPETIKLTVQHDNSYFFAASAIVSQLLQFFEHSTAKIRPGLWFMGHLVDPERMLNDMEKFGVKISRN
ncbi:saccharopine dehydrogenase NADP-binding domain-containing protein [Verrucomicrobiota bacterium]